MTPRTALSITGVLIALLLTSQNAFGYIHFSPMTLKKMCAESFEIRALKVTKYDKEKGVIVFDLKEALKTKGSKIDSFKHAIRVDDNGVKPIFDWVANGKLAVMFSIEAERPDRSIGLGYVFIDEYCYTVYFNDADKCWSLMRAEPHMSACYFGSAEKLQKLAKDVLAGKEVTIPVKAIAAKVDPKIRFKEINDYLEKYQK